MLQHLFKTLARWSSINRYSSTLLAKEENVAEHSAHVLLIVCYVAKLLEKHYNTTVDWQFLAIAVAIHDLDEIVVGDIPRNTKYSNPEITRVFKDLERHSVVNLLESFDGLETSDFYPYWDQSKGNTLEGVLIRMADLMSVVYKVWLERHLGNNFIEPVRQDLIMYLGELREYIDTCIFIENRQVKDYLLLIIRDCRKIIEIEEASNGVKAIKEADQALREAYNGRKDQRS